MFGGETIGLNSCSLTQPLCRGSFTVLDLLHYISCVEFGRVHVSVRISSGRKIAALNTLMSEINVLPEPRANVCCGKVPFLCDTGVPGWW